jgi:hypothetical protein
MAATLVARMAAPPPRTASGPRADDGRRGVHGAGRPGEFLHRGISLGDILHVHAPATEQRERQLPSWRAGRRGPGLDGDGDLDGNHEYVRDRLPDFVDGWVDHCFQQPGHHQWLDEEHRFHVHGRGDLQELDEHRCGLRHSELLAVLSTGVAQHGEPSSRPRRAGSFLSSPFGPTASCPATTCPAALPSIPGPAGRR